MPASAAARTARLALNLAATDTPVTWLGLCSQNPALWDGHWDDDGAESRAERQQRHAIAADLCMECPLLTACERALAAETEPVTGVWAGRLVNEERAPARRTLIVGRGGRKKDTAA